MVFLSVVDPPHPRDDMAQAALGNVGIDPARDINDQAVRRMSWITQPFTPLALSIFRLCFE